MVGLQRGCGAGDRRVAGEELAEESAGKTNSVMGEFRGNFVVSAEGRENLGSEKARGCREFRDEKVGRFRGVD